MAVYVNDHNVGAGNPDNDGVMTDAERRRILTFGFSDGFVAPAEPGRPQNFVMFEEMANG